MTEDKRKNTRKTLSLSVLYTYLTVSTTERVLYLLDLFDEEIRRKTLDRREFFYVDVRV